MKMATRAVQHSMPSSRSSAFDLQFLLEDEFAEVCIISGNRGQNAHM